MRKNSKKIYLIQSLLFTCIVLIQIVIALFFYNEFYNQKNVDSLEDRLNEITNFQQIIEESRLEIFKAQKYLQDYVTTNKTSLLNSYFQSIERLTHNFDTIDSYKNKIAELDDLISFHKKSFKNLPNLNNVVDSIYQISKLDIIDNKSFEIERFIFKDSTTTEIIEVNIEHKNDSLPQKNFLSRLKDAFTNTVDVKKEVTIITTKHIDTLNSAAIENMIDSIIGVINLHYENELNKFTTYNSKINTKYEGIYNVYGELISISIEWMDLYTTAINDFSKNLRAEYSNANTKVSKIRYNIIFALIVLMFVVLAVVIYYVSQAFRYESQLQKANIAISKNLKFKNRILAMLNHEMRSPLHIVNLFVDRISNKSNDDNVLSQLDTIKYTNNQLIMQANQILNYVKNEEQDVPIVISKVNLSEEIESILNIFKPYIEYKKNNYLREVDIENNIFVMTDIVKIRQLFINIIGNANKYTDNGEVSVKIETKREKNILNFTTTISDTGVGINKNDLENLFSPYYQGVISDKVENLGVGLGLNLCKEIVDKLEGDIYVESKINRGTIVTFVLNFKLVDE